MPGGYGELKEIEKTDGVTLPAFVKDRLLQGDGNGVGLIPLCHWIDSQGEDNRVYLQFLLHGIQLRFKPCNALSVIS